MPGQTCAATGGPGCASSCSRLPPGFRPEPAPVCSPGRSPCSSTRSTVASHRRAGPAASCTPPAHRDWHAWLAPGCHGRWGRQDQA
ncbi:hypothetical protein G6F24_017286 [Rhizopus arrhizus]|nr:hypothetical protein G6F24_017286 [Rhizopus arrhizus]